MAAQPTLDRRVDNSSTLYKLRRESVETKLGVGRILDHLSLARVTDQEVDDVLDAE